jgi:hypothetical protein
MLVAPRLSKHTNHCSIETGEGTLTGSNSPGDSLENAVKLGVIQPQSPVQLAVPAVNCDATIHTYNTYIPRSSSLTASTTRSGEVLSPEMTDQRSVGNNIYGIRYDTGGIPTAEHDATEERHPAKDQNPPGWGEALERLNKIHAAAALRRGLSPSPLKIVKRATPCSEGKVQPSGTNILHLSHPELESISELDISDHPRDRNIERRRAAALAKLEGKYNHYTTESVYSRNSDGTPLHRPEGREGRPQWRSLESQWPD